MKFTRGLLYPAAIALLLGAGTAARADLVSWTYNWSRSPIAVTGGTGGVTLTDEPLAHATGNSDIVATNLKVFSSAPPSAPDTISSGAYALTLALTDDASHATGSMVFTGSLAGTFSSSSAHVTNMFTGLTTKSLTLGGNTYTVTVGSYSPPGPPSAANSGSISANVVVTGKKSDGGPHNTPEPSTLLLAGVGLSFVGLVSWSRRSRLAVTGA